MNGFLVGLLVFLGIALGVGIFVLATWVIVWNVNDIIAVGANFWNVFWILLTTSVLFGGMNKVVS